MGVEKIRTLHQVTTLNKAINVTHDKSIPCETCSLTKMKTKHGPTAERKEEVLALVSIDICGPLELGLNGERYFLQILDNYSRHIWTFPIKSRDEAPKVLESWKVKVERQSRRKLRAVRSDNARELIEILQQWERRDGIRHHLTEPYNSIQNGAVERSIQTSEGSMRAMLKDAGMPNAFWPYALQTDAYLRNRTATGPEIGENVMSPHEAYTDEHPSIDHIKVWGCKAYIYMNPKSLPPTTRRDKLMDRGKVGVFLGYVEDTTKAWRLWAPDMQKITQSSNVRFSEYEKGGEIDLRVKISSTPNTAPMRKPVGRPRQEIESTPQAELAPQVTETHVEVRVPPPPLDAEQYIKIPDDDVSGLTEAAKLSKPVSGTKRLREDDNEEELAPDAKHLRALMAKLMGADCEEVPDDQVQDIIDQAYPASIVKEEVPIPGSYNEAISDPIWGEMWKSAVKDELTALASNGTWTVTVPPDKSNIVTSKWVFTTKYNIDGSLNRLKARLVARGFSQRYGVDYEDTFAPTMRHDTLRMFLAVVTMLNLECHQVDVNNAFTESYLNEKIYMAPPPGVDVSPGQALEIKRSLYGLKQAARDWNKNCISRLKELGFTQSEADPCLLTHTERQIILLVYVDDIPFAAPSIDDINWFKDSFGRLFKVKDLGEVNRILGVRISRDRKVGTLRMDQTHYVKDVLRRYSMEEDTSRRTSSPIDSYEALRRGTLDDRRTDQKEYQQIIGSWMYLGILTRPDIIFALGRLSQYLTDPTTFHANALKKVSRYIRSSQDRGILFRSQGNQQLEGYSDSDYAMDKADRVSVLGNVFKLAGGPISWMSRKQKSVATSTMEAEYMAMCACAKQSQWLAHILRDMGQPQMVGKSPYRPALTKSLESAISSPSEAGQVRLYGDNQASLHLVKDAHANERSKHIDIAYHYVRDLWSRNRISVDYVSTSNMIADGLTKPKAGIPFQEFVSQLGLDDNDSPS